MNKRFNLPFTFNFAVLALIAAVYLFTCQTDICSHPSEYVIDSGEYQIALALWGTVHFTGAPSYSLLGAIFVAALRLVGIAPAAGAALFSVVCALVALGFIDALALRLTGNPLAAAFAILALALTQSFWINSVVAEIYAFGLALSAVSLWLAVRYADTRSAKVLYALAFMWGQAIVHHRLAVFMAPALAVLVTPAILSDWRRAPRLLMGSVAMGLLAFVFYLYMPLRARMGAWTYGDPGTWPGFWFIFWAREVPFLLAPPLTLAELWSNIQAAFSKLAVEWTGPGLAAAWVGLAVAIAWPKTRSVGWALLALAGSFLAFVFVFHKAVSAEEVLLWVSVSLTLALAVLVARLWQARKWIGALSAAALVALAGISGLCQREAVLELTRDPRGREVIDLLKEQMPRGKPEPTFMALWGGDYFAAAYGHYVTGELQGFQVVDHRAYFEEITAGGSRLITLPKTFYEISPARWRERLGSAHLSSAGWELVEISLRPQLTRADMPLANPIELGDGISLLSYRVKSEGNVLYVTLYWQAKTPAQDYSVFVHLSDQDQIMAPEHIIAQADSQAPVYGWYPTTQWSAGEIVREDYRLVVPPGKTPRSLAVGMYTQDAAGAFHNLGVVNIALALQEPSR